MTNLNGPFVELSASLIEGAQKIRCSKFQNPTSVERSFEIVPKPASRARRCLGSKSIPSPQWLSPELSE